MHVGINAKACKTTKTRYPNYVCRGLIFAQVQNTCILKQRWSIVTLIDIYSLCVCLLRQGGRERSLAPAKAMTLTRMQPLEEYLDLLQVHVDHARM